MTSAQPSDIDIDYPEFEDDPYIYNEDERGGFHGADEVPAGHPDAMDYMGHDPEGGQPCPHGPHWRHCPTCCPEGK